MGAGVTADTGFSFSEYWVTWEDDDGPIESGPFWDRQEAEERAALFGGEVEVR
jgi:hypothetical protein